MFLFLLIAIASVYADGRVFLASAPIPNVNVIGQANLDAIEAKPYSTRQKWATQLLDKCGVVRNTVALLNSPICNSVINTKGGRLVDPYVSAGGFEAVTDPTYIFDFNGVTTNVNHIAILDNAIGYVLSQGGNGRFTTDLNLPWADDGFPSNYLIALFNSIISGQDATLFWEKLGSLYPDLFSGSLAGFTQMTAENGNSQLLFITPEAYWGNEAQFFIDFSAGVAAWNAEQTNNALKATVVPASAVGDVNVAFSGNDWTINQYGGAYFQAIKDFNNGNSLPPLCVAGLATFRLIALRSAAYFIRSNQEPSTQTCQLASISQIPRLPSDQSLKCPRNLGCSACNAVAGNACTFVKIDRKNDYGACLPRKGAGAWCSARRVNNCNSVAGRLTFPVLSTSALNTLVQKANKKCVVSGVSPTSPATDIYVAATVNWSFNGSRDPGCWNVIQDVINEHYFGIRLTSSVAI